MINLKIRLKNPVFIVQIIMAILLPILAYMGLTVQDLTTWQALGNVLFKAVENPYIIGLVIVNVWQTINDPTTCGLKDSEQALTYTKPNK